MGLNPPLIEAERNREADGKTGNVRCAKGDKHHCSTLFGARVHRHTHTMFFLMVTCPQRHTVHTWLYGRAYTHTQQYIISGSYTNVTVFTNLYTTHPPPTPINVHTQNKQEATVLKILMSALKQLYISQCAGPSALLQLILQAKEGTITGQASREWDSHLNIPTPL